jgi:hypothetical protein
MEWVRSRTGSDVPDVVVVFTDGEIYGGHGEKPRPDVLWIVTIPGEYRQPYGTVVKMDPWR